MSTKPKKLKNENEAVKPFIDLSRYYDDDCVKTSDDWQATGVSDEEAKKIVDDVFERLGDNASEDETIEAFVDAFFERGVRNGMSQDETLKMVDDVCDAANRAGD